MIHGSSRIRSMDTLRPESREATPACMAAQLRAHSPVGPSSPSEPRDIPDTETGWSEPMSGCPRATSRPLRFLWRSLSLKDLPVVGRIKVDDIVGYYNLTAECVFERLPPPVLNRLQRRDELTALREIHRATALVYLVQHSETCGLKLGRRHLTRFHVCMAHQMVIMTIWTPCPPGSDWR